MNAFLLSKHFTDAVAERVVSAVGKPVGEIKLLFSANAGDGLSDDPFALPYIQIAIEELESKGFKIDRLDLKDYVEKPDELQALLASVDATFFTGGEYPVLLESFHKTGLVEYYGELVRNGLVHIGFSAGAMILSEKMIVYSEFDEYLSSGGANYLNGVGIFEGYIFPHYSNKPKYSKVFEKSVKRFGRSEMLIPLENHQGIHLTQSGWEIM